MGRMLVRRLAWLIPGVLVIAALVLALQASAASSQPVITVEWSTASELNTAGFNLYRSEKPDGPFTRINSEIIPGSADPLVGGSYSFTDTNVIAGHTYYYQLEDVETGGVTTRHETVEATAEAGISPTLVLAVALGAVIVMGVVMFTFRKRIKTQD